jgi:hypothetical protein
MRSFDTHLDYLFYLNKIADPRENYNSYTECDLQLKSKLCDRIKSFVMKMAGYKVKFGLYREAFEDYQKLFNHNNSDLEVVSQMILCLSFFNPKECLKFIPLISQPLNKVEDLDSVNVYSEHLEYKKTKKRKRVKPIPKNFDPNKTPDPG